MEFIELGHAWKRLPYLVIVLTDYAMLSWFGTFAEFTGHPAGAYQVGTVVFVGLNLVLLLAPLWKTPSPIPIPAVAKCAGPVRVTGSRRRRLAMGILFAGLTAAALVFRLSAIARTHADASVADMLPIVIQASQNLLAGHDPYTTYQFPSHSTPMQWLPALWLPYVPAVWMGLDPRIVGLAAVLCCAALLGLARWGPSGERAGTVTRPVVDWMRLGLAGGVLLAPAAVWFGAIGHTQVYWLFLIAFLWTLSRRWWMWAGLWLGFCLMSRHTMLPLLPVVGLYAARCLEPRHRWRLVGMATLMVAVLAAPFGIKGIRHFLFESPAYYWQLGNNAWTQTPWWVTHTFGLGTFLYPAGYGHALSWIGILLLMGVYLIAFRSVRDLASFAHCFTLGLLIVTISVPTPFRYEFFPMILLLSTLPLVRSSVDSAP